MPTMLPRVHVAFERPTYEMLEEISKVEKLSMARVVAKLVHSALELAEDLVLADIAERRLATFRRDDAMNTSQLLKWNKNRKKRK